ncbi:hypothetical protein LPJ59_000708 [Coemansia sp. RSA 2399]|nr:hypothetical protein LPJ59_000708 [Coemansia sp. RSA 2399]
MADDDWQTVPERQPRRQQQQQQQRGGGHGRGGYRNQGEAGRSNNNNNNKNNQGYSREGYSRDGGRAREGFSRERFSREGNSRDGGRARDTGAAEGNWRTPRDVSAAHTQPRSRSRPSRGPPAPSQSAANAAANVPFKLQTSNMFEVHVSKGSRARNNAELKEFFETRDDGDEEDTFDAIDDDDLDLSGYESEDDDGEATSFPPVPIQIKCPFCSSENKDQQINSAVELTKHLRDAHGLAFKSLSHMALMLQRYLDAWAERLPTGQGAIDEAADKEIRDRVQRENLDVVLAKQAAERRTEAQNPRKCLFCKLVCDNRASLFRHGFREHNFNIGLPDNLVGVAEFLQILEAKLQGLQCLYCEKTFTSAAVLRKHMRKKKHFKISAHNRLYDRFYVVNYVEPGKSWEAIEAENACADSDTDDRKDDSWADWDDKVELPATSLLDAHVALSAADCCAYMRAEYAFDIDAIRRDRSLDFYRTVVLVNYIRHSTANRTCFACTQTFETDQALAKHFKQSGAAHLQPPADGADVWDRKEFLKPAVEDDPLLLAFDDDDDEDGADEETSRKRLEASKKAVRERLGKLALDRTDE